MPKPKTASGSKRSAAAADASAKRGRSVSKGAPSPKPARAASASSSSKPPARSSSSSSKRDAAAAAAAAKTAPLPLEAIPLVPTPFDVDVPEPNLLYRLPHYAIEVPGTSPADGSSTGIYRSALLPKEYLEDASRQLPSDFPSIKTLHDGFELGSRLFPPSTPCLGRRERISTLPGKPEKWTGYKWETLGEVVERRTSFARGLARVAQDALPGADLAAGAGAPGEPFQPAFRLAIYAVNRPEWVVADAAALLYSLPTVALYDTLGADAAEFILNHAEIPAVVASLDKVPRLLEVAPHCPRLKIVVSMDGPADPVAAARDDPTDTFLALRGWAEARGVRLLTFREVEQIGRSTDPIPFRLPTPDDLACLSYTSGTTGTPKGVMLTHRNIVACLRGYLEMGSIPKPGDVHISYLPLAHVLERIIVLAALGSGCPIGFFRGDVKYLMEDIALVRPTVFVSVPRLLNRIVDTVNARVAAGTPLRRALFAAALAEKMDNYHRTGTLTHGFWDALVFSKVRSALGGRVRLVISGSAPLPNAGKEFLRVALSCQVAEGYGLTENCAGTALSFANDFVPGNVGAVTPSCEIKLVSIPDMGYLATDKPRPRGEIWQRGTNVFAGYYKDEAKTREALTEDGWLLTGDVGAIDEKGRLYIIDRKKNMFKLSQGEYVAPEKLEGDYSKSPLVAQIFVHGDSTRNELVAVIVPDTELAVPAAVSAGALPRGTPAPELPLPGQRSAAADAALRALADSPGFRKLLLAELGRVATAARMSGIERVRAVRVATEMFATENGLLTPTMKLRRSDAARVFRPLIDEMYAEIDAARPPHASKL
ncbi:Long chain acyl-CoA synthetase 7 peroxisomal [Cladochytrium tenue]|nr:Long chain acyl-CoA synthetase 7 peroxisomal [Cladochytrium tenue]